MGPFSSTVFSSLLEWLDLGLGVPSARGVFGSGELRRARVGPRKESQSLAAQAWSRLSSYGKNERTVRGEQTIPLEDPEGDK